MIWTPTPGGTCAACLCGDGAYTARNNAESPPLLRLCHPCGQRIGDLALERELAELRGARRELELELERVRAELDDANEAALERGETD